MEITGHGGITHTELCQKSHNWIMNLNQLRICWVSANSLKAVCEGLA